MDMNRSLLGEYDFASNKLPEGKSMLATIDAKRNA